MDFNVLTTAITFLVAVDAWAAVKIVFSNEGVGRKLLQIAFVLLLPVVGAAIMIGLHRSHKSSSTKQPPYSNENDGMAGIQGSFHHDGS